MFKRWFSRVPVPAVILGLATALVVGCSDSSKLPAGPSASATSSGLAATADGSGRRMTFRNDSPVDSADLRYREDDQARVAVE